MKTETTNSSSLVHDRPSSTQNKKTREKSQILPARTSEVEQGPRTRFFLSFFVMSDFSSTNNDPVFVR